MDASGECRSCCSNPTSVPCRPEHYADVLREKEVGYKDFRLFLHSHSIKHLRSFFLYASLSKVSRRMQREGQASLPFVATLFRRHSDQVGFS